MQPIPPFVVDRFLYARERRTRTFVDPEHEPLDDERAQMIVSVLETVRLWGGEERALLKEAVSRIEAVAETCTAIKNELGLSKGQRTPAKIVPVETLDEAFVLNRPILVVIEHSEGIVTATYYECEVFGEGETEFEALADLKQTFVEYYLQLRQSAETLGPLPAKHLRILSNLVCEN
ncbi:MAG: hypothetical protein HY656_01535 [Acidobacteria bacterium]|nr:hypothetical protein [Acidobacteriota bacterium]